MRNQLSIDVIPGAMFYGTTGSHLHQINLDGQVVSDFERDRLHREVLRTQGQLSTRSEYDRSGRLRALFVSANATVGNNPDNITVSPRGGIVLCEDGGNSPDSYGPGARLLGLTRDGASFYLAKNNVALTSTQIANAGKSVGEGDYRDSEFCGACWTPDGRTLFVNLQSPGITVAITGPWLRGPL